MVREIIEVMLGEIGRQILYFYEANALVINVIVLTYGLTILMSWLTLTRIYRHLVIEIAKSIHLSTKVDKDSSIKKVLSSIKIPWEEPVRIAKFPFIASQIGLYPVKKTVKNIQKLLDEEELVKDAIAVLNGKNPRKITPRYRKLLEKQESLRKRN